MESLPSKDVVPNTADDKKDKGGKSKRKPNFGRKNRKFEEKRMVDLNRRLLIFCSAQPVLVRNGTFNIRLDESIRILDGFYEITRQTISDQAFDYETAIESHLKIMSFLTTVKLNEANLEGRRLFSNHDFRQEEHRKFAITAIDQLFLNSIGATSRSGGGVENDCFPLPIRLTLFDGRMITIRRDSMLYYSYRIYDVVEPMEGQPDPPLPDWQPLPFTGFDVPLDDFQRHHELSNQFVSAVKRYHQCAGMEFCIDNGQGSGSPCQLVTGDATRSWCSYPVTASDLVLGHAFGFGLNLEAMEGLLGLRDHDNNAVVAHNFSRQSAVTRVLNEVRVHARIENI